jgi:hypothetical protein
MTDEQCYNYLLKNETRKTWNAIIKKTGRKYEELQEIYKTACLPEIRKTNEENSSKYDNCGVQPKRTSLKTNTGYPMIDKLKCGEYSVRLQNPNRTKRAKTIEEALEIKEKYSKRNRKNGKV